MEQGDRIDIYLPGQDKPVAGVVYEINDEIVTLRFIGADHLGLTRSASKSEFSEIAKGHWRFDAPPPETEAPRQNDAPSNQHVWNEEALERAERNLPRNSRDK